MSLIGHLAFGKTLKVEMRFKQADEVEKAARLKLLHQHQVEHLEGEDEQLEQVAQLISNNQGKSGSFPGDINSQSSLITAPVQFGGQTFDLTLDTGSTVLWVSSVTCASPACAKHRNYNSSSSATFSTFTPATDFEIEYGSGSIGGYLATETISMGNLRIENQLFGVVEREDGSTFDNAQWSGLLGLAYPALAAFENHEAGNMRPFFDSIIESKQLNENAFSFWLVRSTVSPPMFFLGAPPPQYYQGVLEFFDVIDKYYWTLHLEDILVDGVSLGLCPPPRKCRAVVDSGTTYMSAPTADLPAILTALTGSTASSACQHVNNKTITYVLDGGRALTLEPEFYFTKSSVSEFCKTKYIGLDVEAPHGPVHIFGDVLFRKYFIHFDRDHDRVGFAVAKQNVDPNPSLQSLLMEKLRTVF